MIDVMREQLFSKIDLSASKMRPYEGFIFLCGGQTNIRSPQPASIRDAIYRQLAMDNDLEPRIRIAEHYKDWSQDSIYRDLVSFERHLAELSSVIVLVLESPGSIAELGLFSVIEEFRKKLLVFVETTHYQSPSFIRLGPIDFLEKIHENTAECHRWMEEGRAAPVFDPVAAQELQYDLAEAVIKRAKKPTPERPFSETEWLDCALLLCDFLNLCSALTISEIKSLYAGFNINKTQAELKQIIFLLEKVGLIAMEPKGDQRFYVSLQSKHFLKFHIVDKSFDLHRFRSDQLELYESEDKRRYRAIREVRSRYAKR